MYHRSALTFTVALLALASPVSAQDTATVTDRQLRQRLDWALTDTRKSIAEQTQVLARIETLRSAVHQRITRDSLAARQTAGRPPTTPASSGKPGPSAEPGQPGQGDTSSPPPAAAVLFEDGFEGQRGAGPGAGFRWAGKIATSSEIARTGSQSMKFTYSSDADLCADSWSEQRFELGENLREVWFEYYMYLPSGTDGRGPKFVQRAPRCARDNDPDGVVNNNKFFALWDLNYSNVNTMFLLEYRRRDNQSSYIYNMWGGRGTAYVQQHNGTEGAGQWNGFLTDAMRGRWVQVRIHARLSDSKEARNGLVEVWFDGVRRINETGIALMSTDPAGNFFRNGYLMGWANSGFDQPTSLYVDDFRVYRASPGWR